jgi:hypothetical protein
MLTIQDAGDRQPTVGRAADGRDLGVTAERMLSPQQIADLTGLGYTTVRREIQRGNLPGFKLAGKLRVLESAYERWRTAQPVHAPPRPPGSRRRNGVAGVPPPSRRRAVASRRWRRSRGGSPLPARKTSDGRRPDGKWIDRWFEGARKRQRTFDRKGDRDAFRARRRRAEQLDHDLAMELLLEEDLTLSAWCEEWCARHAGPTSSARRARRTSSSGASGSSRGWATTSCAR